MSPQAKPQRQCDGPSIRPLRSRSAPKISVLYSKWSNGLARAAQLATAADPAPYAGPAAEPPRALRVSTCHVCWHVEAPARLSGRAIRRTLTDVQRAHMSPTIAVPLGSKLLHQCRKPTGLVGRVVLWRMNRGHSKVTDWGLAHVTIRSHDSILDVGCGGGRTVAKLASLAVTGKVCGVDFSEESVAASGRTNRELISAGRVEIRQASASELPFANDTFDVVTAVETHYYWPDLNADFREILRVLKPRGRILVVAESYRGGKYDRLLQHLETLQRRGIMKYAHLSVNEHRDLLSNVGYSDVAVVEEYDKGWLCAVGLKKGTPSIPLVDGSVPPNSVCSGRRAAVPWPGAEAPRSFQGCTASRRLQSAQSE